MQLSDTSQRSIPAECNYDFLSCVVLLKKYNLYLPEGGHVMIINIEALHIIIKESLIIIPFAYGIEIQCISSLPQRRKSSQNCKSFKHALYLESKTWCQYQYVTVVDDN